MSVLLCSEIQNALASQHDSKATTYAQVGSISDQDINVCNFNDARLVDGVLIAHVALEVGRYTPIMINGNEVNVFAQNNYPVPVKYNPADNSLSYEYDQQFVERRLESIALYSAIIQNDLSNGFDLFKGYNNSTIIGFNPFVENSQPFTSHPFINPISADDLNQNISNAISHVEEIIKPKLKLIAQNMKPNSHIIFGHNTVGKTFAEIFE